MVAKFSNSIELLANAKAEQLYEKLLAQLQKDFDLSNVELEIPPDITPLKLKSLVQKKVYCLLSGSFTVCMNLLYIIDVPEKEIKKAKTSNMVGLSEQVCFLILKREWQKVWLKHTYSS